MKIAPGHRLGRLTVISRVRSLKKDTIWLCRCDCGKTVERPGNSLRPRGAYSNVSCGCTKHGHARHRTIGTSPEYAIWDAMRQRCTNQNHRQYAYYGGRGIRVCDSWLNSFQRFLEDVGSRPSRDLTLDRYPDNDGNYEPGNVRWATRKQQIENQRPKRSRAEMQALRDAGVRI